jgi:dienelactone hydrolase
MMRLRYWLALVAALVVLPAGFEACQAAALIEESVVLPAVFGGRTIDLEALVIRPDDGQPHPLAVINHGSPRNSATRQEMTPRGMRNQALEFARRGWVAVSFLRRGYGGSEGEAVEMIVGCADANYEAPGRTSAEDIREVIRLMKAKPYVDGRKIISVGHSAGGFASVALTANPPGGLVAAINFAGGRGSRKPDEVCNPSGLVGAFATFGRTSRVPMLWVYAANDHFFGPTLARQFHAAFTGAGGRAELVMAEPFGDDGHRLFSSASGVATWTGLVDSFLARLSMSPETPASPPAAVASMPSPAAGATTHYPTGLGEQGRAAFDKFLAARGHKAFAMSSDGHFGWRTGRDTVDEAIGQALDYCRRNAEKTCVTVMVDDQRVR